MKTSLPIWLKRQINEAAPASLSEGFLDPLGGQLIEAAISRGEMTRTEFWELMEEFGDKAETMNLQGEFALLSTHLSLCADFTEVWDVTESPPYPALRSAISLGAVDLPKDFIRIGGDTGECAMTAPICPSCDRDMAIVVQLDSLPRSLVSDSPALQAFTFGDMWQLCVFGCQDCWEFEALLSPP